MRATLPPYVAAETKVHLDGVEHAVELRLGEAELPVPTPQNARAWLEQHATAIMAVEPHALAPGATNIEDLAPLATMTRDARIVALGDNPHNASELFRLRHPYPAFLVDLRPARDVDGSSMAAWLRQPVKTRSIGSSFESDRASYEQIRPAYAYDALVYLEQIHAAHPTPTGVRLPRE